MSEFIVGDTKEDGMMAFFQDDGKTGYLYLSNGREVIKHLQIYNTAAALNVKEEDVMVIWSKDGSKCGVVIWDGLRGVIDMAKDRERRIFLRDRNSPSIEDPDWLSGFEEG